MVPTIAVSLMVGVLTAIHLRTRRHPNWKSNANARFYVTSGYSLVAIAIYFLSSSSVASADWTWVVGNVWAFIAVVSFVFGFNALNADRGQDRSPSAGNVPTLNSRSVGAGALSYRPKSSHHN